MKASPFTVHVPSTLDQAVDLMSSLAPFGCRILAGGQSLIPLMAFRMAQPPQLVDINRLPGLSSAEVAGSDLIIQSLVRHSAFGNAISSTTGALLAHVMQHIAHVPIRNRGTFCGSLAHADPASEWCLVLATLDGKIRAQSSRGTRVIEAAEFFRGFMDTSLEPDEIVVDARLPILEADTKWGFYEFARRPGDYALAMALAVLEVQENRISAARIGVGAAEEKPRRLFEAEGVLLGKSPGYSAFESAAKIAALTVQPLSDIQADAEYRRDLVYAVVRRALEATCDA